MSAPKSIAAKLTRANLHLAALNRLFSRWTKASVRVSDQREPDGSYVVAVEPIGLISPGLGGVIGDCLYNWRSVLDHLAFALAIANLGEPLPPQVERTSHFPVLGQEPKDRKKPLLGITGIRLEAQEAIEKMQPYQRGIRFRDHPLWMLNELANFDTHRAPHVALAAHIATQPPFPFEKYVAKYRSGGVINKRTELVRYLARQKVNFDFSFDLIFAGGPLTGRSVLNTLAGIKKYINATVVPTLSEFLSQD